MILQTKRSFARIPLRPFMYGVTFNSTPASGKSGSDSELGVYPNQLSSITVPIAPFPVERRPVVSTSRSGIPLSSFALFNISSFVVSVCLPLD